MYLLIQKGTFSIVHIKIQETFIFEDTQRIILFPFFFKEWVFNQSGSKKIFNHHFLPFYVTKIIRHSVIFLSDNNAVCSSIKKSLAFYNNA